MSPRYAQGVAKKTTRKKAKAPRIREVAPDEHRPGAYEQAPRLADIIAQERAIDQFERALASRRLHHAWLFQGPRGVGKCSTALALARILLDPDAAPDLAGRIGVDPQSPVQRLIDVGGHPDLHVVNRRLAAFSRDERVRRSKQTNIPVEVVREFLIEPASRSASMSPGGAASKVLIVDEAHLLAREGQNAMLKTLEEPPQGTVIILVTDSESRLATTILSRCQRIAFRRLDETALRRFAEERRIDVADWMLRVAHGSPGELLRLAMMQAANWYDELAPMVGRLVRGRSAPQFGTVCAAIIDRAAEAMIEPDPNASKRSASDEAASVLLRVLADLVREQTDTDSRLDLAHAARLEALAEAQSLLARNVQPVFVFDELAEMLIAGRAAFLGV